MNVSTLLALAGPVCGGLAAMLLVALSGRFFKAKHFDEPSSAVPDGGKEVAERTANSIGRGVVAIMRQELSRNGNDLRKLSIDQKTLSARVDALETSRPSSFVRPSVA